MILSKVFLNSPTKNDTYVVVLNSHIDAPTNLYPIILIQYQAVLAIEILETKKTKIIPPGMRNWHVWMTFLNLNIFKILILSLTTSYNNFKYQTDQLQPKYQSHRSCCSASRKPLEKKYFRDKSDKREKIGNSGKKLFNLLRAASVIVTIWSISTI